MRPFLLPSYMPLYQFNEIYSRVTGEYKNDIQILFFESDGYDILVFDLGCFYLVNKPAQINLEGFNRYFKNSKKNYDILRIVDNNLDDEAYIELEGAIMRIASHFSTADGQTVKDFWLFFSDEHRAYYDRSLQAMESAKQVELIDLRFILPAT